MTDFYSFINSKDIEKYLREINYEFAMANGYDSLEKVIGIFG